MIGNKGALQMLDILKFSLENLKVNLEYNWIDDKMKEKVKKMQ